MKTRSRTMQQKCPMFRHFKGCIGLLLALSSTLSQGASKSSHSAHRRVDLEMAREWALELEKENNLNIEVDHSVVKWVNHYLDSREGRRYLQASLKRKLKYEKMMFQMMDAVKIPRPLIAIPLVESGFSNVSKRKKLQSPVGLWQFEAATARRFNLTVTPHVDERKQAPRATLAALKYLKHLHRTFGNWSLAIAAYNQGEGSIKSAIGRARSRDVGYLLKRGHLNDYSAKISGAMLAMHHVNGI